MIGGTVIQVIARTNATKLVEVLNEHSMDRCWRIVGATVDIREGDLLWWQSFVGFHSRTNEFADRKIGYCKPGQRYAEVADEVV